MDIHVSRNSLAPAGLAVHSVARKESKGNSPFGRFLASMLASASNKRTEDDPELNNGEEINPEQETQEAHLGEAHKRSKISKERKANLQKSFFGFLWNDQFQSHLSILYNLFSLLGNGYSSVVNALPVSSHKKNFATKLGAFATMVSLGLNGTVGALNQLFVKKNPISGLAHLAENLIIALFPQYQIYLARGLNSGINLMSFGLGQYNTYGTDVFHSFDEYFKTITPHLKDAFSELSLKHMPDDADFFIKGGMYLSNVFKNLAAKDSGLLAILNGAGMTLGTVIALVSPFKMFGEFVRNTAGLLQDFDRFKDFENKPNNFYCGVAYLVGSILNYAQIFLHKKWEPIIAPLVLGAGGLARYFFRRSQDEGEMVRSSAKAEQVASPY